ncbi:MAG TPA: helix-hairpin-helix domain-containing protein [Geobacteraceae bacterium]|nr:helix-hairpin-helix domain-containing protein [Geobacteraceae bacterium]
MKKKLNELKQLKGVGEVLSRRLAEAGYDTFAKVVAAGEEGLKKIQGINQRMLPAILEQAGKLVGEGRITKTQKVAELKRQAASLKEQVQGVALRVRENFQEELAGKTGKKVEKQIMKVIASLEKVEGKLETRVKKAGKGMEKAGKSLALLAAAGLADIGKGLKKARKSLKKV